MKLSDTYLGLFGRMKPGSTCRIDGKCYKLADDGDLIELSPESEEAAALEKQLRALAFGPCYEWSHKVPSSDVPTANGMTIYERALLKMKELEAVRSSQGDAWPGQGPNASLANEKRKDSPGEDF